MTNLNSNAVAILIHLIDVSADTAKSIADDIGKTAKQIGGTLGSLTRKGLLERHIITIDVGTKVKTYGLTEDGRIAIGGLTHHQLADHRAASAEPVSVVTVEAIIAEPAANPTPTVRPNARITATGRAYVNGDHFEPLLEKAGMTLDPSDDDAILAVATTILSKEIWAACSPRQADWFSHVVRRGAKTAAKAAVAAKVAVDELMASNGIAA